MYEEIIRKLKQAGVSFAEGLSVDEIRSIEGFYEIHFPRELILFYQEALPVSEGFYDWKNFSEANVKMIRERIRRPKRDLLDEDEMKDMEWKEVWGEEPTSQAEKEALLMRKINNAPTLVPVFKHRYIANQYKEDNPVLSIYGSDMIYYGENLSQYLLIEFGLKGQDDIDYKTIQSVDFWSDFI